MEEQTNDNVEQEQTPTPEEGSQEAAGSSEELSHLGLSEEEMAISDDELMGMDEDTEAGESASETPGEKETETPHPSGDEGGENPDKVETEQAGKEQPTSDGDEATAESEEKGKPEGAAGEGEETPQKPPKGFVPLKALQEERTGRKAASVELESARREIESLRAEAAAVGVNPDEFKDFKKLSADEFEALVEDDPTEAIKYQAKLGRYESHEKATKTGEANRDATHAQFNSIVDASVEAIEEIVPGIYDEDNSVSQELGQFAIESGFDPNFAAILTDPRTMILAPGADKPVPLGTGAVGIVTMVNHLRQTVMANDPDAVRKAVEEQIKKEATAQATAETLRKIKEPNAPPSISDAPAASQDLGKTAPKDEAGWDNLSPDEEERFLAGG